MTSTRHGIPTERRRVRGVVGALVAGVAAALGLMLVTAACGTTMQTVPAREAPPIGGDVVPAAPAAAAAGLATVATPLGQVVTIDGYTVYRFAKDKNDPATPTCTGDCAKTWPPVLGDGTPALDGVPADLVGTVGRPDGTSQLTLNGWPLYRYAKDAQPGDTSGQDVGGAWKALGANGKPATPSTDTAPALPAAPAPTPAPAADDTSADQSSSGY